MMSNNNKKDDMMMSPPVKVRRGCRKGGKHVSYPQSVWFQLCLDYEQKQREFEGSTGVGDEDSSSNDAAAHNDNNKTKKKQLGQTEYLRRQTLVPGINVSHAVTFSRNWRKFKKGTLRNTDQKRQKPRQFQDIEHKLIEFINLQKQVGEEEVSTWEVLQEKCRKWALELGYGEKFKASPGWLATTLKRYNQLKGRGSSSGGGIDNNNNTGILLPIMGPTTTNFQQQEEAAGGGGAASGGDRSTAATAATAAAIAANDNNNTNNSPYYSNNNNNHAMPSWLTDFRSITVMPGCFSCPQWEESCKFLEQQKNAALARVHELEQDQKESQQRIKALEKEAKKKDKEIERLKGVVKVSLDID